MNCQHKFEKFNPDLWWCPNCNKIFEAEEVIKYYQDIISDLKGGNKT